MKKQISYLIIITIVIVAVGEVLLAGELLFVDETPLNWNYQQLNMFDHSLDNFSFTYSGDERDDNGNFSKMINSINSNYPNIQFNINGGDLKYNANELYNLSGNI